MARSKLQEPPPSPELLERAARELARYQQSMDPAQWHRLVRCKALAKAKEQRRHRELASHQGPGRPADLPRPATRRPPLVPNQRTLFDARRAAANDLDDDDDDA